jgi:DNA invertase Pin-like site-specific DNA recombinase
VLLSALSAIRYGIRLAAKAGLSLLAAIADFERDLIRERTGEGRKRAMAVGVKFGRKRKLSDYHRAEAVKRRAAGETLVSLDRQIIRRRYLHDFQAAIEGDGTVSVSYPAHDATQVGV